MHRKREAKDILEAIKENRFIMKDHAAARSAERSISRRNVINVARTVLEWKFQ